MNGTVAPMIPALTGGREDIVISEHVPEPSLWDGFVKAHPHGSLYHLAAWQNMIFEVFGHRPAHIVARDRQTNEIRGVLPLFYVRSRIFGRMLVSTPHAAYGGILAISAPVYNMLLERAGEMAKESKAVFLELRNFRNKSLDPRLLGKELYVTVRHKVDPDPDKIFNAIPKKTRYEIRESLKNGLEFKINEINCNDFYEIYSRNVWQLGTPVFPRQMFSFGAAAYGSNCRIFSVHYRGKPIAATWTIFYKDEYLPHFACSLREYNRLSVNNFMYWMMLKYGAENGYTTFDFGRSKLGTGSLAFKKHWGMTISGLDYQYLPIGKRSLPDTSSLNPKLSMSVEAWKRLPLPITRLLGPVICKHLI